MDKETDILIVDDDRDLVNSMRIVLQSRHYSIRSAHTGKEGFDQIAAKIPDLIILDVMMATDTDGFDLAFKLKNNERYRDIPILMLTSFPMKMAEQGPEKFQHILGEAWPVSKFMEKPVDPDVLLASVAELLQPA